jgi:hypothetical protein
MSSRSVTSGYLRRLLAKFCGAAGWAGGVHGVLDQSLSVNQSGDKATQARKSTNEPRLPKPDLPHCDGFPDFWICFASPEPMGTKSDRRSSSRKRAEALHLRNHVPLEGFHFAQCLVNRVVGKAEVHADNAEVAQIPEIRCQVRARAGE